MMKMKVKEYIKRVEELRHLEMLLQVKKWDLREYGYKVMMYQD
jgi:hypothetical protein